MLRNITQAEATELMTHTRAMTTLIMRGIKFGLDSLSPEERRQLTGWYGVDWQQFCEWAKREREL